MAYRRKGLSSVVDELNNETYYYVDGHPVDNPEDYIKREDEDPMKNTLCNAMDEPVGICALRGDCNKWPENPPCCWLSCSEICGAACLKDNVGKNCSYFREEENPCLKSLG